MRKRLLTSTTMALAAMGLCSSVHAANGETIFEENCAACHDGGGAPQLGDADAWQPRIDEGVETLYANAIDGVGNMPAKGGNADLSDDEVKAAVDYIVTESR